MFNTYQRLTQRFAFFSCSLELLTRLDLECYYLNEKKKKKLIKIGFIMRINSKIFTMDLEESEKWPKWCQKQKTNFHSQHQSKTWKSNPMPTKQFLPD